MAKSATVISRGGGKWLKEGRTARKIIRLPINGVYFSLVRY